MLASVREFAESGRPVYAECGGLMYLCREMETVDGRRHPMAGILPTATKMHRGLQALAYVDVTLKEDSLWGLAGERPGPRVPPLEPHGGPRGHRGLAVRLPHAQAACRGPVEEGFQKGNILASYAHLHLASRPRALERFIRSCEPRGGEKTSCSLDGGGS
jgi:cobyrinic acid a,c-diamide synthase